MGLFGKKSKAIEKLNQIEQQGFVPLNTFNLENQIMAKEAAIDSQVGNTNTGDDIYYNTWLQVNQWADYFCGTFKYEANEFKHNIAINRALRAGFIYGSVGVWNNNGTPELVQVRDRRSPTEYYEIIIIYDDSERYYPAKNPDMFKKVPKKDVVIYQFDSLGYSAFLTLQPVLKFERLTQKALYNETLVLPTRILHDVDAGNPSTKAAKQFVQFNSSMIHRMDGGTDRFSGLALATNTEPLLQTIEYTKNYYYDLLGRRTNSDFKRAHSLDSEISAAEKNCQAIETSRYLFLKKFLREYSMLFDVSINLENLNGEMMSVFDNMETGGKEDEVKSNDRTK